MEIKVKGRETGSPALQFRRGDTIPVHVIFKYKGMPQPATLTFSIGHGVYPIFTTHYTWPARTFNIGGAMDWEAFALPDDGLLFVIPSSVALGLANIRGTLKTVTDVTEETDTNWSVLEIIAS